MFIKHMRGRKGREGATAMTGAPDWSIGSKGSLGRGAQGVLQASTDEGHSLIENFMQAGSPYLCRRGAGE